MKLSIFQRNKSKSDKDLLTLFKRDKDLEVLGELYHRYIDMVMGLCLKYLKHVEDSEDAVMEIFEILIKRLPNHDVSNFKSWLYRLSSNHCLDILRRKKRLTQKEIELANVQSFKNDRPIDEPFSEELSAEELLMQSMDNCIEQLGKEQQICVKMFYLEKRSYEEVSNKLGISWSQTRSFIQNGRRNLKKCMEKSHETAR